MDAAGLLLHLHGRLLRAVAVADGRHFQGLRSAAGHLRRDGRIKNQLSKKLERIDDACALIRHVTQVSADLTFSDLINQLEQTKDEPNTHKGSSCQPNTDDPNPINKQDAKINDGTYVPSSRAPVSGSPTIHEEPTHLVHSATSVEDDVVVMSASCSVSVAEAIDGEVSLAPAVPLQPEHPLSEVRIDDAVLGCIPEESQCTQSEGQVPGNPKRAKRKKAKKAKVEPVPCAEDVSAVVLPDNPSCSSTGSLTPSPKKPRGTQSGHRAEDVSPLTIPTLDEELVIRDGQVFEGILLPEFWSSDDGKSSDLWTLLRKLPNQNTTVQQVIDMIGACNLRRQALVDDVEIKRAIEVLTSMNDSLQQEEASTLVPIGSQEMFLAIIMSLPFSVSHVGSVKKPKPPPSWFQVRKFPPSLRFGDIMTCINDVRRDCAPRGPSKYVENLISRVYAIVKEVPPTHAAPMKVQCHVLQFMLLAIGIMWRF